jgi:type II secretory pathway pseudopilin PulG
MKPICCNKHARKQAAFTLVELVVAIGLMSLLVSLLFTILTTAQETVTETRRSSEIHENARVAINRIKDDLLNCKPPRNDRDLLEPGQMFVIRNSPEGINEDELWFTTGSGTDSKGCPIRTTVRYFVEEDEDIGLKVLKRREFRNLHADYFLIPEPEEGEVANICEYVEHFDVQYLNFVENKNYKAAIPENFIPELDNEDPLDINFRKADIWKDSGLPANQTAPSAIRITMIVRDRRGRQTYFIQRVFWIPFSTYDPSKEEPPPPEEEEPEE